jgi:hypothetical protein
MCKFAKILSKLAPSLTAAVVLTVAFQAQATATASASGPLLLAQSAEPQKEPAPSTAPPKKAPGQSKSMAPPASPRMKKMEERGFKTRGAPKPMPEASGTKKIGGQTIRDKEAPEGE